MSNIVSIFDTTRISFRTLYRSLRIFKISNRGIWGIKNETIAATFGEIDVAVDMAEIVKI